MAEAMFVPITEHPVRIQWMWMSNKTPFSPSEPVEWTPYTDLENIMIEKEFKAGKSFAMLDDYLIDFQHNIQISNIDESRKRRIKRCELNDIRKRIERFTYTPISTKHPFAGLYGWISPFIKETAKHLNITRDELPSKNEMIVPKIVEEAALGIIKEGMEIGKSREATQMAKKLMNQQKAGMKEVWKCCVHLYTIESFLYKRLNETMRLIGSKEHEHIWRSRVRTLGPFCLLLWDNPFSNKTTARGTILYRGANLTEKHISSFKKECSQKDRPQHSFQSFISCSRNRIKAEPFGNVLFIMTIKHAFSMDIQSYSEYSDEEEEIISPGVCFTIDRVEELAGRHLVYLNLVQQYNSEFIQ